MNISGPAAVAKPEMLFYAPGDLTVTIKRYLKIMTRPKSERLCFGALLGRVFHVHFNLSKGMLFGIPASYFDSSDFSTNQHIKQSLYKDLTLNFRDDLFVELRICQ